jgi:hypothetical protein
LATDEPDCCLAGYNPSRTKPKGAVLRKFALIASVCTVLLLASFAQGQHTDVAVGFSTIFSGKYSNTASQAFLPAAEKGGLYPSFSVEHIFKNRLGFSAEFATRAKQGLYNGYQGFRPIFYDVNAAFAPRLSENLRGDFTAGVGGESVVFYNRYVSCSPYYPTGCLSHISDNHLLVHIGGGVRYYVFGRLFVRPEAHFYRIFNNTNEFSSNNVVRVGVSLGYTFGPQ